jgi:hypothetical protein
MEPVEEAMGKGSDKERCDPDKRESRKQGVTGGENFGGV